MRLVREEGLRVAVVPGERDAEPGCEGRGLRAAYRWGLRLAGGCLGLKGVEGGVGRTGRAAVVEEDVGVGLGSRGVGRDRDCVLVALAGAGAEEVGLGAAGGGHCVPWLALGFGVEGVDEDTED